MKYKLNSLDSVVKNWPILKKNAFLEDLETANESEFGLVEEIFDKNLRCLTKEVDQLDVKMQLIRTDLLNECGAFLMYCKVMVDTFFGDVELPEIEMMIFAEIDKYLKCDADCSFINISKNELFDIYLWMNYMLMDQYESGDKFELLLDNSDLANVFDMTIEIGNLLKKDLDQ